MRRVQRFNSSNHGLVWSSCGFSFLLRVYFLQFRKHEHKPQPQNGGRRNPWPRLPKYPTNRGVFWHVTHGEMAFSEVVSSVWRPCLFSAIGNRYSNKTKRRHFIVFAWRNSNEPLEPLWQTWPGEGVGGFSDCHFEREEGPGDEVV